MKQALIALVTVSLMVVFPCMGQLPIDVTDQTIKIGPNSEETFYFGFAEGDQIVFSFSEVNGKELKEVEILEYPATSKFSEFKTSKIDRVINVNKDGVYMFRLFNGAMLAGRICKMKIQRIPSGVATESFTTNVNWITIQDTTWNTYTKDIVVGYDTTYVQRTTKELIKTDTVVTELFSKTERVHSATAIGKSQYTHIKVDLPENSYSPSKTEPYQSKEVVAWSYWIGVGQKAEEEFQKANSSLSSGISVLGAMTGYGALASLAVSGISMFGTPSTGDNVQYKFLSYKDGQHYAFESGNGIAASGRNDKILQGGFTIELYNDNFREGIDVTVKVIAVELNKQWEDRQYTEQKITPRLEKKIFKEPVITTSTIPSVGK